MTDASTTRSALTYTSLVAAIVIPLAQKHFGISITVGDVADGMAALALAYHGVSTFIEARWPPKTSAQLPALTPEMIDALSRAVIAELKTNVPFAPPQSKETP